MWCVGVHVYVCVCLCWHEYVRCIRERYVMVCVCGMCVCVLCVHATLLTEELMALMFAGGGKVNFL